MRPGVDQSEEPADGSGAARDGEGPAVVPGVVGGGQDDAEAGGVDERQLVEIEEHGGAALTEPAEAIGDVIHVCEVELAAHAKANPTGLTGFDHFKGHWLDAQRNAHLVRVDAVGRGDDPQGLR